MLKIQVLIKGIFISLLFFLFSADFSSAQTGKYIIHYKGNTDSSAKLLMSGTLIATPGGSEYWETFTKNPAHRDTMSHVRESKPGEKEEDIFKDLHASKIYFKHGFLVGKPDFYVDDLQLQKWVLLPETREIDSIPCSKAACIFRNRVYIAWYADKIPIPDGPWKLNGLPGLIVEAYDDSRVYYWKMTDMAPLSQDYKLDFPKAEKTFAQMKEMFIKNYQKIKQSIESPGEVNPNCAACKNNKTTFSMTTLEYLQVP